MKAVNQKARKIMQELVSEMNGSDHMEFEAKSGFMSLVVERIGGLNLGPLYSFTHYYTQNGDAMRDPDMIFILASDRNFYPISFRQDGGLPLNQESVVVKNGVVTGVRVKMQRDQATFAGIWMNNVKQQRAPAEA